MGRAYDNRIALLVNTVILEGQIDSQPPAFIVATSTLLLRHKLIFTHLLF